MEDNKELTTDSDWCEITEVGLRIIREPTWDEYQEEWNKWEIVHSASAWALGDLLAYGERKWGETYVQVSAHTKYSIGYLRNIQYVCSNVPIENRRYEISMSHHQTAAKLDNDKQQAWLDYAVEKDLSRDEFRQVASNEKLPPKKQIGTSEFPGLEIFIPEPEEKTLERIVVAYIRAVKEGDDDTQFLTFQEMEEWVGDLL